MEALTKYKPNVEVVSDPESLAQRSVEIFVTGAQKAVEISPTAKHYSILSQALFYNNKPDLSLQAIEKAIDLDPSNATYKSTHAKLLQALRTTK